MDRLPDFYIVGAPKCGTTSLHRYLRQHPDVFMPAVKEPNFFCSDFPSIQKFKSLEDYSTLFEPAQENQLVGEASPWYLYSKTAIQNILDVQPDAKFIVMLRNPVDAVISHFNYMRYYLVEDRDSILEAVITDTQDGQNDAVIRHRHTNPYLKYQGLFSYSDQIERMRKLIPAKNILVVLFEEFFQNPAQNFSKITDFLNLPPNQIDFKAHNQAKQWRFDFLRKLFVNQSQSAQHRLVRVSKFFQNCDIDLRKIIFKIFSKDGRNEKLDSTTLTRLQELFSEDVKKLRITEEIHASARWEFMYNEPARHDVFHRKMLFN